MSGDAAPLPFAGDVFLTLAAEGRLVLDAVQADEIIAGLESTLAQVRSRMRIIRIWQDQPMQRVDDLPEELAPDVIDAVFLDQLAPGQLEQASEELPKYIEALRHASCTRPSQ
jgi:hypothetical protein